MALARVVAFEDVSPERMERLRSEMSGPEAPPEDVPATELLMLHDPDAQRSLAILIFDNEQDYARGDAALGAMPAEDTPGRRVSVDRYEVAMRRSATGAAR